MISVIIPNWNGARYLPTCLDSLRRQTYADCETIVVDNASTDESVALMARDYPEVRLLQLPTNRGLTGGVNAGIAVAKGEIIALLNNDTEADPRWLAELSRALAAHPEAGMAASKMLLFDRRDVIHSAGDFYRTDGVPGNRGVWQNDKGQFNRQEPVFSACGGACAYRRAMLDDVGLLDESLFMYLEDVDLAWRAQLRGYGCIYVPTAIVYHRLSATGGGPIASFYCGRNFIAIMAKDVPGAILWRHWLAIVRAQLGFAGESLRHFREPAARARLRGQLAGLGQLPLHLRQRRLIQAGKRVSDEYIEALLTKP
jgi:GT2 family glycosyltransferase